MLQNTLNASLRICVVGSGYVGIVAAFCFAEIGHYVICVDSDAEKIALLKTGVPPIFENHLPGLVKRHLNRTVEFTTDLVRGVRECDAVFIAVGTPQGISGSTDLSHVEAVVAGLSQGIDSYKVIVEKSTVPVCTSEWITRCLLRHGVKPEYFDVASNPEFLREGTAVMDSLHPDRIVIGVNNDRSASLLRLIYEPLTSGGYYSSQGSIPGPLSKERPARLIVTSTQSAELIKHASNAFLAMKISFINAVANLAEAVNGDIEEIAAGMGLDARIGSRFLSAGLGYGGSCFPKDVAAFSWVAQQQGIDFQILEEVRKINVRQQDIFFQKVKSVLRTLRGKRAAALGLAFKAGTDDIRESPATALISRLLECGTTVCAYDPAAMEKARALLPASTTMKYAKSAYEAAENADAVLILTDWPEFAALDLPRLKRTMRFPIIVDGRNLYKAQTLLEHGFTYISIGRPPVYGLAVSRERPRSHPAQIGAACQSTASVSAAGAEY